MLHSMTGYGSAKKIHNDKLIKVELRSLNSKAFDVRSKLPEEFKAKELEMRNIMRDRLVRGKIELTLTIQSDDGSALTQLDSNLFKRYYTQLKSISEELNIEIGDVFQTIATLPDIVDEENRVLDEDEWIATKQCLNESVEQLITFRKTEGEALRSDLKQRAVFILNHLDKVSNHEDRRNKSIKNRLTQHMKEFLESEDLNMNRYEQEVLYYMERLDITEEKVRLRQHCDYFLDILMQQPLEKGRKLNFIAQEMGREINTLGAKSNFSEIQHIVVLMKDELEKIKEQVYNVV